MTRSGTSNGLVEKPIKNAGSLMEHRDQKIE